MADLSNCLRLSVWSGPRNISTALMYSFRERTDARVVDEPLYGHYLKTTEADHPGAEEVMRAMDNDGERVVREVILGPRETPMVFFKNMAHHLAGLDRAFLQEITNVLLTRDPREMLPSLAVQLPSPTLRDTGLGEQIEILEAALNSGNPPVVLDACELLLDPAGILQETCAQLGIHFYEEMLRWPAGPRPEDGIWAKHWYRGVYATVPVLRRVPAEARTISGGPETIVAGVPAALRGAAPARHHGQRVE